MRYDTRLLEKQRLTKGWLRKTLAERIGVDPSTIGRVERGEIQNPETVKKMADALGVDMEDLILDTETTAA